MRKRFAVWSVALLAIMLCSVWACTTSDNPNAPDIAAITATAPAPGSPAVSGPEVTVGGVTASFSYYLPTEAKVTFKNNSSETQRVHLASYCVTEVGDKIHSQYRKEAVVADVKNDGRAVVLKVAGCICRTQYDAGLGDPFPEGTAPFYTPDKMLDFRFAGAEGNICIPPSPPPPPPNPTCDNYTKPTITGDISMGLQLTLAVFDRGTVAPNGGTFNPVLPASMHRPAPGQPPGSFSNVYELQYGPSELQCFVRRTFLKPVPPRESVCSSEWDRSSYDNPILDCSTWIASLHNGGDGPGLCPVTYHVQKAPLQGQPNWVVIYNGTMPPLGPPGSTGTISIVTIPPANGVGKYRVVFDQHPAHPGSSNPTTNSCTYNP